MITINRNSTNHNFEKQNLVTQFDRRGQYDVYKCSRCGLSGKARDLVNVDVGSNNKKRAHNCPKAEVIQRVRITKCHAVGKLFENLHPGTLHDVVAPPAGYDNSRGVWVMGVGEPVKVFFEEFELVE